MRWGERSHSSSRRSSDTIRWVPRLLPATAWISSMITCSMPARVSRARLVSIRNSDSGVVIRICGRTADQPTALVGRGVSGAHSRRSACVHCWHPSRSAASPMPRSGARRFFSISTASARSGDTYSTRVAPVPDTAACPADMSRSMAHRNAASVLPVPVGAQISVWPPAAMCGQPSACGAVGAANVDANQARVGSEKAASGSAIKPEPYRRPKPPPPRPPRFGREHAWAAAHGIPPWSPRASIGRLARIGIRAHTRGPPA